MGSKQSSRREPSPESVTASDESSTDNSNSGSNNIIGESAVFSLKKDKTGLSTRDLKAIKDFIACQPSRTAKTMATSIVLPPVVLNDDQRIEFLKHQSFLKSTNNDGGSVQEEEARTAPLFAGDVMTRIPQLFSNYGLLGQDLSATQPQQQDNRMLLNVGAPWSAFLCGVQGSGKSHSLSCILENCLIQNSDIGRLSKPLAGLVFHWDKLTSYSSLSTCEAATLASSGVPVRVLVSPTNYEAMRRAYENIPGLNSFQRPKVVPLHFSDQQLNVKRMMTLMGVHTDDEHPPLYLQVLLRILREMAQKRQGGAGLNYGEFRNRLAMEDFTGQQNGPLGLRLDMLESFLRATSESKSQAFVPKAPRANQRNHRDALASKGLTKLGRTEEIDFKECWNFPPGTLTIVDLSCPFVDENAACALFSICLELFLEKRASSGRVVALDEAHKFLTGSAGAISFTEELLHVIRIQRHIGTRIVIATQEPTISPKLLDLCNFTIVHRFQSPDWFKTLKSHLAGAATSDEDSDSPEAASNYSITLLKQIMNLQLGQALLFAPSAIIGFAIATNREGIEPVKLGMRPMLLGVRQRLTADGGRSVMAE